MDYLQEIDSIMDKNKDVLERLKGDKFSSWENQDLFHRARLTLQMGYPVYVLVEIDDKTHEGELVDLASDVGIIEKSGAWYSYNGEKIGQGRENVKKYLAENPNLCQELEEKIRNYDEK